MEQLSAEVLREVLLASPRPLQSIKAELLLLDGLYLLHYRDGDADQYKFLSPDSVRAAFEHEVIDSGWINCKIQRWGSSTKGNWVVLFVEPQKHRLDLGELGIVTTALPGLVFFGLGKSYWVWAVNSKKFNSQDITYHAPLPNVYEKNGAICWGSVHPPDCTTQTINTAWQMFIESTFNSHLCQGKSVKEKSDVRKMLIKGAAKYPVKDLVGYSLVYRYNSTLTIDELVTTLLKQ
ncbi:MAG TPA: hypothetical protein V6D15_16005 [Oculatellaceae cyanobacterium]|jgi:hypothetical protein